MYQKSNPLMKQKCFHFLIKHGGFDLKFEIFDLNFEISFML